MAEILSDLTILAEFQGTRVPEASPSGPCLSLFGPILTHPSSTTFPWSPLRHALNNYFGGAPLALDPNKIHSGWCGLSLILTAFRRLEVVDSELETAELLSWLQALKVAAVRRSLAFEITSCNDLQQILSTLAEPVPAAELANHARARTSSAPYAKPIASTSTSFERGSDATRSPPPSTVDASASPESSHPRIESILDRKRSPGSAGHASPAAKKRRSNSLSHIAIVGLGGRPRDSTVSTSALSSFADFSDHHDMDLPDYSSSEEEGEKATFRRPAAAAAAAYSPSSKPHPPATVTQKDAKINLLAQRLSEVTGISLDKCIETIGRFPDDDLSSINPHSPIPAQFLPPLPQKAKAKPRSSNVGSSKHGSEDGSSIAGTKPTRTQRPHDPNRPSFSYSALIGQAILSTGEKRMRLAEIYDFVTDNYAYYKKNECGWQNSIRHNLSLQPVFRKVPDVAMPGKKGCFWTIIPGEEWRFANGGWLKMEAGRGKVVRDKDKVLRKKSAAAGRKKKEKEEEESEEDRKLDKEQEELEGGAGSTVDALYSEEEEER